MKPRVPRLVFLLGTSLAVVACSSSPSGPGDRLDAGSATGGTSGGTGGSTGGRSGGTGGNGPTGGLAGATGGRADTGGRASGGSGTGGGAGGAGGRAQGGGAGVAGSAGQAGGRAGNGGAGSSSGGAGGANPRMGGAGGKPGPSYLLGADVTNAQWAASAMQDSLFKQLKDHGFNAIRARTFVDPKAADGYDKTSGVSDRAHTVAWGKRIKEGGFQFLLDFHYSDNWADPGKQCVPVAWQSLTTIADLAKAVHDYTRDTVAALVAAGARPDMVQVGNEITPGMLIHRCDSAGAPTGNNPVTGSIANWANLGALLKAGVQGVKDVDPSILIMLHIDRCHQLDTSKTWIDNALKQGVSFDVFGESCYQRYQGDPDSITNTVAIWTSTFSQLVTAYPQLRFVAAEYGPAQREINDVLFKLPNEKGFGTFNWEPESSGDWNTDHALFDWNADTFTAKPDLALYDAMKAAYAARL